MLGQPLILWVGTYNDEQVWKTTVRARTTGVVSIFYRMKFEALSIFSATTLRSRYFYSSQKENKRVKTRAITFYDDGRIETVRTRNGKSQDPVDFTSKNMTLDPIAAAFFAKSLPISVGSKSAFDVYNGWHRYLVGFTVDSKHSIKIKGKKQDAYKVVPTVEKLTDSEGEKRLNSAALWVSTESHRRLLMLDSDIFLGSIKASLRSFTPKVDT